MPYIKRNDRLQYDPLVTELAFQLYEVEDLLQRAGHVNYIITTLLLQSFPVKRYGTMALVDGVLTGVGREYYRRRVAPYEDAAIKRNGDLLGYAS